MTVVNITKARNNIYQLVNMANENSEPVTLTNSRGKNAVLVGEEDWNAICETLYLNNIPGLAQSIIKGSKTPISKCVPESEVNW
ncbi:MAG: type II toxin-antitoxin system Phd/YefM family antitoxin [Acidaminococcaceae bacterium]|nr:type II toxin-antitoxin system Phd/YefM family antitoxin [Acidaminococcaceae bacterium]MDO4936196.1 type II toxin-antitoxin system Phd/YefM family antitoxin [Phascolarctobacterium sp.]